MKTCRKCGESEPDVEFEHGRRICRKCRKAQKTDWRRKLGIKPRQIKHKVPRKFRTKSYNLRNHFGITLEDYNQMFEEQKGRCAICGIHQSEMSKALSVDHNHNTGEIRGLLCNNCNTAIGKLKTDDGIELLQKAMEYIGY
jgi:hypothetical protein